MIYRIADTDINIENKYDYIPRLCKNYVSPEQTKFDFTISVDEEEIDRQLTVHQRRSRGYTEGAIAYYKLCREMLKRGGFMLHSSVVGYKGYAYAFAAKSGTGKSTHTALWQEAFGDEAIIVNGDKPIIKTTGDCVYVYGTPWCGKENKNQNVRMKLGGICFIERAEENSIEQIGIADAVPRLITQVFLPKSDDDMALIMEQFDLLVGRVPMYLLKCNMDVSAARVAYALMGKGDANENS